MKQKKLEKLGDKKSKISTEKRSIISKSNNKVSFMKKYFKTKKNNSKLDETNIQYQQDAVSITGTKYASDYKISNMSQHSRPNQYSCMLGVNNSMSTSQPYAATYQQHHIVQQQSPQSQYQIQSQHQIQMPYYATNQNPMYSGRQTPQYGVQQMGYV